MNTQTLENRLRPRIEINSMIGIQLDGSSKLERAELDNLSEDGASIWSSRALSIGTKMLCIADSGDSDEESIEFNAIVVRIEPSNRGLLHGYGCMIEIIKSPDGV